MAEKTTKSVKKPAKTAAKPAEPKAKSKPAAITAKRSTRRSDVIEVDEPSGTWPKITQGSHLTVIAHENGRTELVWDDAALLRDVRAAMLKADSSAPAGNKSTAKSKGKAKT